MTTTLATATAATALRVDRVRAELQRHDWAALLVLDAYDLAWLTGLRASNAAAFVTADRIVVATDFRYITAAESLGVEVRRLDQAMHAQLGTLAAELVGSGLLAYPPSGLSHRAFMQLTDALPEAVTLRAADGVIAGLRMRKDAGEIEAIRRSAHLLQDAYDVVAGCGLAGRPEAEVAWLAERSLREAGASAMSFEAIVAGGSNGARPHHDPGTDPIPDNTLVTVDVGCIVDGYCSDCTRTFAVGRPGPELQAAYALVLEAQQAALDAVRPGAAARELDTVARDIIVAGGHGDHFGHGLGHGVGLEVHEGPRLSQRSDDVLEAGMVITVEPGVYLPGVGGVRIEDLAVVTEGGHEVLTGYTKELVQA